jgi:hypothetical protein
MESRKGGHINKERKKTRSWFDILHISVSLPRAVGVIPRRVSRRAPVSLLCHMALARNGTFRRHPVFLHGSWDSYHVKTKPKIPTWNLLPRTYLLTEQPELHIASRTEGGLHQPEYRRGKNKHQRRQAVVSGSSATQTRQADKTWPACAASLLVMTDMNEMVPYAREKKQKKKKRNPNQIELQPYAKDATPNQLTGR